MPTFGTCDYCKETSNALGFYGNMFAFYCSESCSHLAEISEVRKQLAEKDEALRQLHEAHDIDRHASGMLGGFTVGRECAVLKHYAKTKEGRPGLCDCGWTVMKKALRPATEREPK